MAFEAPVLYRGVDLDKSTQFASPGRRDASMKAVARREMYSYLGSVNEDELLGEGRVRVSEEVRKRIGAAFTSLDAGVEVVFAGIIGAHPPKTAAKYFEKVVEAEQQREGAREQGLKEAIAMLTGAVGSMDLAETISAEIDALTALREKKASQADQDAQVRKIDELFLRAGGKAGAMLDTARGDRWERHMGVRGRAARYAGQLAAATANPAVYRAGLYFEMLRDIVRDSRVYITTDNPYIRIEAKDPDTGTIFNATGTGP